MNSDTGSKKIKLCENLIKTLVVLAFVFLQGYYPQRMRLSGRLYGI